MRPGSWFSLERWEDDDDKISFRWPMKTARMWEIRLKKRLDADIRVLLEQTHRSLASIYPAPAIYLFFPQDYNFSGHLVRIRKVWENLPVASYGNWRKRLARHIDPGYFGTGIVVVPSKYVLRKLAEESPIFMPIWEDLKGLASDDCGIYLAEPPDAAWLESIQPDEQRLYDAFRDTRHLDKIGLKLHAPGEGAKEMLQKAINMSHNDEHAGAEKILEDLLERYPDYWRVWGTLVKCLKIQGKHRQAYEVVRRIQRRHPDCLMIDQIAIFCCMEMTEWRRAEWHIKRLWGLNPWDPYLMSQYATVAYEQHDYKLAVKLFEECAEHGSLNFLEKRPYAVALGKIQRGQEALDILVELEDEEDPDPILLNNIGWILTSLGRPKEGLTYCRRALDIIGEWSPGWDSLGFAHLKLGNLREATAAFLKAIHLNQESPNAWRHLLHAYYRGGQSEKLEEAKVFARKVLPGELARFEKEKGLDLLD